MNSHISNDILSNANLLSHYTFSREKCEQNQINHRFRTVTSKFNGLKMVQINGPERGHIDIRFDASQPDFKNASYSCPNESWINSARCTEKRRRRLRHNNCSSFRMNNIQTLTAICAAMLVLGS